MAPAQRYDSIEWVLRFPNLIVARTFSKAFLDNYGLPQWLRITIGLPEQNERVLAALE